MIFGKVTTFVHNQKINLLITTGESVLLVPKIPQVSCLRFSIFAVKPRGLMYFASKPKA